MSFLITITDETVADIEQAAQWYEGRNEGLGKEFSETVLQYLDYLSGNAHSHPKVRGEYRELLMRRFPFVIIYRIIRQNEVIVLGIIHTKKHPSKRGERK